MPSFDELDAWLRKYKKAARIRQAQHLRAHTKDPRDPYAGRWWWNEIIRANFCETLLEDLVEWCSREYQKEVKAGRIVFAKKQPPAPATESGGRGKADA